MVSPGSPDAFAPNALLTRVDTPGGERSARKSCPCRSRRHRHDMGDLGGASPNQDGTRPTIPVDVEEGKPGFGQLDRSRLGELICARSRGNRSAKGLTHRWLSSSLPLPCRPPALTMGQSRRLIQYVHQQRGVTSGRRARRHRRAGSRRSRTWPTPGTVPHRRFLRSRPFVPADAAQRGRHASRACALAS